MKISISIATLAGLTSLIINAAIHPSVLAAPAEAKLTPAQIQQLRSLGIEIAVPTYIPNRFRVDKVKVQPCPPGSRRFCPQYTITYRGPNNTCFAIESTGGGIGGVPEGDRTFAINSPLFGDGLLELGKYGQSKTPTLLAQWLGNGPFYRFTGAGVIPELSRCNNISPQEAVRVTESLQYLKP